MHRIALLSSLSSYILIFYLDTSFSFAINFPFSLSAYNFTLLNVILSLQNDLQRRGVLHRVISFIALRYLSPTCESIIAWFYRADDDPIMGQTRIYVKLYATHRSFISAEHVAPW